MLKPTVGMELGPMSAHGPRHDALMVARSNSIGTRMKPCRRWLAQLGTDVDLLDSELSSLDGNLSACIHLDEACRHRTVFPHQEGTHRQNSEE